jgi:hypothetical protein
MTHYAAFAVNLAGLTFTVWCLCHEPASIAYVVSAGLSLIGLRLMYPAVRRRLRNDP